MRRKKTTEEQYRPYLLKFMAWKDGGQEYGQDTVFTQAQLLEISSRDLVRYMCLQAYKTADPTAEDKLLEIQQYWKPTISR
jgi:hypothetical protein